MSGQMPGRSFPVAPQGAGSARGSSVPVVLAVLGIVVGAVALLLVAAYLALALGAGAFAASAVLALLPLTAVLLCIRWVDRWEPEPRAALLFAFLWGAGVSVAAALVVDLGISVATAAAFGAPTQNEVLSAVVQAPVVEEVAKGAGILVLLLVARAQLNGPVDGLVYGATVAAGFAFTENILYFGQSLVEAGPSELAVVFVVRGVFSPFAHVMFTACTGLALGMAATSRWSAALAVPAFAAGLVPAVLLHALWNGAFFVVTDLPAYYVIVQVPLFLGLVAITVWLRVRERAATRRSLASLVPTGLLSPAEVEMLASAAGRRRALGWASTLPGGRRPAMRTVIRAATRLAAARGRVVSGAGDPRDVARERRAVEAFVRARQRVLAP